ncbi:MAG: hypothetical protein FWC21_00915 [Treponema sp.]|nr:hypothetical protein [Treponema sp.]
MKKVLCVAVLIAVIGAGTAFADFGIGVHAGGGMMGGGGGLNLAFSNVYIYVDALYAGKGISLSGAVDFLQFLGSDLGSNFSWYWRLGIPVSIWGFDGSFGLAAGARFPVGISWKPIQLVEIFLQLVPQVSLQILPEINLWHNFIGGNLGVRFWF